MGINQTIKDNALSLKPFGLGLLWTIDSEFLHKLPLIDRELSFNYQFLSWAALCADALLISQSCEQSSSQSRLTPEIKTPRLRGFATPDRCNFAREHGIGGIGGISGISFVKQQEQQNNNQNNYCGFHGNTFLYY